MFNMKENKAPKIDPTLVITVLALYKVITRPRCNLTNFRTKVQMPTPFLRDKTLKNCARVLYSLPEAWPKVFFFSFGENVWSAGRRYKFPEKHRITKIRPQTTTTVGQLLVRAHRWRVQSFTVWLEKTAWTDAGGKHLSFILESACISLYKVVLTAGGAEGGNTPIVLQHSPGQNRLCS